MEAKNVLHDYRVKHGLTQDELAEKVFSETEIYKET